MTDAAPCMADFLAHRLKTHLRIRHKATGKGAIGVGYADGTVLVQFNDINHPHGHGWHLYPRHQFHRRRGK